MNRPPSPPYGALIEEYRLNHAKLSIREAARRAGISDAWWRYVVTGWQNGPVTGPADTVATMARVVGVPADEMESRGERPDVAELLRAEPPSVVRVAAASIPQPAPADDDELAHFSRFEHLVSEADPRDRPTLQAIARLLTSEGEPLSWAEKFKLADRYLGMFDQDQRKSGTALSSLFPLETVIDNSPHSSLCGCTCT